jgi:hypothetical protein
MVCLIAGAAMETRGANLGRASHWQVACLV